MESLPEGYRIVSAEDRPDITQLVESDLEHPTRTVWPEYILQNISCCDQAWQTVEGEAFAKFQFYLLKVGDEGQESVIGSANSIPFFWPELVSSSPSQEVLDTLPDGGLSTVITRGARQYLKREGLPPLMPPFTACQQRDSKTSERCEKPNALCALAITLVPGMRQQGLADMMIKRMKQAAIEAGFHILVVPLRPTKKAEYPLVDIEEYMRWEQTDKTGTVQADPKLPFDPWLRKHIRMGARLVKAARSSTTYQTTRARWSSWINQDLADQTKQLDETDWLVEPSTGKKYTEITFQGGLAPLRVYKDEDIATYIEPNIWIYHPLSDNVTTLDGAATTSIFKKLAATIVKWFKSLWR
ncbi:hypothetical protein FQN57_006303 [Myotisia sp. PD_48]|nr:hypothetical protein FQN57_006303 [Myotisia sp. PD_48]